MTITNGEAAQVLPASENGAGIREGVDQDLLVAHYGWVRAVARNLVRDHWGAEDVTQETLLAALAAPPRDAADAQRLRAWLGRVAFNLSRLGSRQGARRRARELCVARREALPSASDEIEAAASVESLSAAIGELSEPYRSVVLMRYFDGLSTAEIAARTETSELAVRKRLWRARKKLRAALDYDAESGQLFAALLPWLGWSRRGGAAKLAGLAAGLVAVAGATWRIAAETRHAAPAREPGLAALAPQRVELSGLDALEPPEAPPEQGGTPAGHEARRPLPPHVEPLRPPVVEEIDPRMIAGLVLDLEGTARAGLDVVDPAASGVVLATTDLLGGFRVRAEGLPGRLEARGEGWTTLLAGDGAASAEGWPLTLVVAPGLDVAGRVVDESGRGLDGVRLELVCDESAWARIPRPVRLSSAVLRVLAADAGGGFSAGGLPLGAGLWLRASRAGFATLERPTLALEPEVLLVLRALADEPSLAGRVLRQDGRPAVGASVRLALASTTTDDLGRFQLPLRGVQADSTLEARDDGAAPALIHRFGQRLRSDPVGEVELVLGPEHDRVAGRLVGGGTRSPEGWLVVAYALDQPADAEPPAARVEAGLQGDFELALPRGTYALYAMDPQRLELVQRAPLDTRLGRWQVELPAPAQALSVRGHVRDDDGLALAGARLQVLARADGPAGSRRIPWRELATDRDGGFAFEADPALLLELRAEHEGLGRGALVCTAPDRSVDLRLPAASFVQVAGADERVESCSLLDGEGRVLAARGPLHESARFGLHAGQSPVLEVPAESRWLEVQGRGLELVRIPLALQAGEVVTVRP